MKGEEHNRTLFTCDATSLRERGVICNRRASSDDLEIVLFESGFQFVGEMPHLSTLDVLGVVGRFVPILSVSGVEYNDFLCHLSYLHF